MKESVQVMWIRPCVNNHAWGRQFQVSSASPGSPRSSPACASGSDFSWVPDCGVTPAEPVLGGGGKGDPFLDDAWSCSALFLAPSANISSNPLLGDKPPWCRGLRPPFEDAGAVAGTALGLIIGGGAMLGFNMGGDCRLCVGAGEKAFVLAPWSFSKLLVSASKRFSPGPCTSSPRPTGSR